MIIKIDMHFKLKSEVQNNENAYRTALVISIKVEIIYKKGGFQ